MLESLLLALGLGLGVRPVRMGVLAATVWFPVPVAVGIGIVYWRLGTSFSTRSLTFCEVVSDELRGGSSLRSAIGNAARSVHARDLAASSVSLPIPALASSVAAEFPDIGPELLVCIERSSWSGSPAADLFDEIATIALAQVEVRQEVRVALAPARATALVLLVGPLLALWKTASSGTAGLYLESAPQRIAALLGFLLIAASFMVGIIMIRRSR